MSITNKIYQRFWIQVLGLLVIDMIVLPFLPWWTLIVPAFIFGRIYSSPCNAFLAPGLGGLLSWAVMILFRYKTGGEIILSRVTEMMGLHNPTILVLLTLCIPLVIAGLAGVLGKRLLN